MSDSEVEVSKVPPKIDSLASLGPYIASHDNSENLVYFNTIPDICKDEPCLLGVDEAGRGPVLGPMVYGIAFCPISKPDILKDLGCADSKTLTEEKRETIFDKMSKDETSTSLVGWAVDIISPNFICNSMFRRSKSSLNEVSMNSAISLIKQAAEKGVNIAEVYVDTVGPPEKYQAKLSAIFPDYKITVAKKADSTYPIVSAASIAAKVSRDHALKVWRFQEGLELKQEHFGSGYPGDPVTKKFLRENIDPVFGYPQLVRFSWSTAETALQGTAYNVSWDDEEEDTKKKGAAGMKRISSFFAANGDAQNGGKKKKTHQFFTERHLQIGSTF